MRQSLYGDEMCDPPQYAAARAGLSGYTQP
jgi:hypothetical protein